MITEMEILDITDATDEDTICKYIFAFVLSFCQDNSLNFMVKYIKFQEFKLLKTCNMRNFVSKVTNVIKRLI